MIHTGLYARGAPSVKEISNGSTEITLFRADRLGLGFLSQPADLARRSTEALASPSIQRRTNASTWSS